MKRIFTKVFLNKLERSEFLSVKGNDYDIKERVVLKYGKDEIDVTFHHWILGIKPLTKGVFINRRFQSSPSANFSLKYFDNNGGLFTTCQLTLSKVVNIREGSLLLFHIKKIQFSVFTHCKAWFQFWLLKKNKKHSFFEFKGLAAAFSFPRKVYLVAASSAEKQTIFPMDLTGKIPGTTTCLFGLRHTSPAQEYIVNSGKIVAAEIPALHKDIIYELGKNRVASTISTILPLKKTQHFGFLFPAFSEAYREIEVENTINIGSQMLFIGKIFYEEELVKEKQEQMYHLHSLYASGRIKYTKYTIV